MCIPALFFTYKSAPLFTRGSANTFLFPTFPVYCACEVPSMAQDHPAGTSSTHLGASPPVNGDDAHSRFATTLYEETLGNEVSHQSHQPESQGTVRAWFRKKYNYLREKWIWVALAAVIASLVICIPVGWALKVRNFDGAIWSSDDMIELEAIMVSVDADNQKMTMDWYIGNSTCDSDGISGPDFDIYFDQNLLRTDDDNSTATADDNIPTTPIFTINGTIICPRLFGIYGTDSELGNSDTFRTDIAITTLGTHTTGQAYPFDKYSAEMFLFATYHNDSSRYASVSIWQTSGLAVGFNAKLDKSQTSGDVHGSLIATLEITRGTAVKAYAVTIVIAIWFVTLTFLAACISSVFLKRKISSGVLVTPVATLFAFTSLRGSLPGAPTGFGADLDFVGILPCLAILTICSVFMTAVFLFRNPEKDAEEEKVKTLKSA